ncbi:UBP1-associated 2A-like [Olea europaea subsp. europaea]|uniref:UBP1-associated 2A-like n=1 Tax=Olea europaea subsp. europaea TaxID=158383 RepID=A0A8S0RFN4_OLEEU|nr:UBP1-associated 2A-like [Olea europaea subsp. europaea]
MARKRKAPASAAPPHPEPVQQEPQIEQPDLEEDPPIQEEEPEVEEVEEIEVEEEEEEEEAEQPGNTEEPKTDEVVTDPVKNGQENVDDAVSGEQQANGETGGERQNEEEEEEFEEEPIEKLLEPFSKDQLAVLIKEALSKYPDFIESVHKLADADPSHRKIFVHGLGWDANVETLTSVFGKYGEIEDCKVVSDKASGKSKGYGFILYKHRNGARKALTQPQKKIGTRMTSCQLASAGPAQTAPPAAVATVPTPPVSEYTQRKIYISNVSAELDPNKLLEFFSKFGEIEEGPLGLDKQTGKPRGFCLFVYKSLESAKKVLEEPHKNFEGHTLHCQKAVDGPKHSKGHYNQQHTSHQQQNHLQGQQGYYHHSAKKGKYAGSSGTGGGHLMAPSHGPTVPVGFNPAVAPAAIGQAVAALLATQGAGLGIGNLLGGMGGMNPQGVMPGMSNAGYGGQSGAGGYGGQPGMQGGYGGQQQMGQGGVRPQQGGAPYMGRGR